MFLNKKCNFKNFFNTQSNKYVITELKVNSFNFLLILLKIYFKINKTYFTLSKLPQCNCNFFKNVVFLQIQKLILHILKLKQSNM